MTAPMPCACMCGAVRFDAVPKGTECGACHCGMCRKWSGGVFLSVSCGTEVTLPDDAPLRVLQSSAWGERVSCAECGSSLIWRTRDGQMNMVSVQAFDNPSQFTLSTEIFIDEKPSGYGFHEHTHKMTGAEVMAMFAPKPEAGN